MKLKPYTTLRRLVIAALFLACLEGLFAQTPLNVSGWFRRDYTTKEDVYPLRSMVKDAVRTVTIPVDFSRSNEFFVKLPEGWTKGFHDLECTITFPSDFPADASLYFSGKDWDNLWYNHKATLPKPLGERASFRLPLFGKRARESWVPGRHSRKWHQLTPYQLREFGFKLESPRTRELTWAGTLTATLHLHKRSDLAVADGVENLRVNKKRLKEGETFEVAFEVPHPFEDPFDTSNVNLVGEVLLPNGQTTMVQCFYYENFHFDGSDEFSKLIPAGTPEFRLRYTPAEPGTYQVYIAGTVGKHSVSLPEISVVVEPAPDSWKGFVTRLPGNNHLLAYSKKKEEFWGLGLNVRSPFDTRYKDVFPATKWEPYNLNMYKRLFKKYKENGISIVEVWMSSWWLGLEWIPDASGNHGVGHMNQWRSWKLDRLLEWAAEYDIHVILAIHNHGKFSAWCDEEWDRNPYNIANGGYLTVPEDYFTHERAKKDYQRFADYMIARWAHSPQILAWKLFTEIDLTGSRNGQYRRPSVAYWHRSVGKYIKQRDPYDHLITTHWSSNVNVAMASPLLAASPELDILTLDAYYLQRSGLSRFYTHLKTTKSYQTRIRKPCIITEYGGTPWADSIPMIRQQLHFAMWHGFFSGFPAAPFLWWFPLIEEQNLYGEFKALATFTKDEPRDGCDYIWKNVASPSSAQLESFSVRGSDRMLGWVVDTEFYLQNRKLHGLGKLHKDVLIGIDGLQPGRYRVDFYDCKTGRPLSGSTTSINNSGTIKLPEFRRDIAFKVTKVD